MKHWQPPQGFSNNLDLIRISASSADDDESDCPELLATKAHPQARLTQASGSRSDRRVRYEPFTLGKVMDALDRREFDNCTIEQALAPLQKDLSLHPASRIWITHAVKAYVSSFAAAPPVLRPVRDWWVAQRYSDRHAWEIYTWGRRYQSDDGKTREMRLLRMGKAGQRARPKAQLGIIAYTVAFGAPAAWPNPWTEKFQIRDSHHRVDFVRVVEVGLLNGSSTTLFEGSPEDADRLFGEEGRGAVRNIAAGGGRQPGSGCATCKQLTVCPSLLAAPKLLPITDASGPLRTWSVTDGRLYKICPLQQHMRRQRLPPLNEYGPEAARGKAVHGILATAHQRAHVRACERTDFTSSEDDLLGEPWKLQPKEARDGHKMLQQHLQVCPLQNGSELTNVRCEPTLTIFDPKANVIVLAEPDMLYEEGAARIWRETKTTVRPRFRRIELLREYPQLALGVMILNANLLGGDPTQHRIELETLGPDHSDIEIIEVADPNVIETSREVIHDLVASWYADAPVTTRPGPHCKFCPYQKWCPENASPQTSLFGGSV